MTDLRIVEKFSRLKKKKTYSLVLKKFRRANLPCINIKMIKMWLPVGYSALGRKESDRTK